MPLPIIIVALAFAIFLFNKKPKLAKVLVTAATTMLLVFSFYPVANSFIGPLESQYKSFTKLNKRLDYIVILGCGHTSDNKRPALQQLKICSLQRLTEGLRIAQLHPEAKVITSGAAIYDPVSNAEKVKQAAMELGLDESRIIVEDSAKHTEDEALYIGRHLIHHNVALVPHANHMPRSMEYFELEGANPIAAPTGFYVKTSNYGTPWQEYFPDPKDLEKTQTAWYETLGRIWQWLKN